LLFGRLALGHTPGVSVFGRILRRVDQVDSGRGQFVDDRLQKRLRAFVVPPDVPEKRTVRVSGIYRKYRQASYIWRLATRPTMIAS